jgi:hypothetical protein
MSEVFCRLCNNELAASPDTTEDGFWAITIEDPLNPGVARAHSVHTNCMRENYPELVESMFRQRIEMSSRG